MTAPRKHSPSPRDEARAALGALLRESRENKALSVSQVARVTKIPPMSLERLEAGRFDELPAQVFVRGFLKSYASCVGLDVDDVVERYLDGEDMPRRAPRGNTQGGDAGAANAPSGVGGEHTGAREPTARTRLQATGSFLRNQLFEHESPTKRRGAVTLAVIILVIVATLTMSYLLRRPSYTGDGVTRQLQPTPDCVRSCQRNTPSEPSASV